MRLSIRASDVYLYPIPQNMVNVIYSNKDGGDEGIKYRYLEWLNDIISKNEKQPNPLYLTLKDSYAAIVNYLNEKTPVFFLEEFNFVQLDDKDQ